MDVRVALLGSMSNAYFSNLTLYQWELLDPLIPVAKTGVIHEN